MSEDRTSGWRFNPEVNLGAILQIGMVLVAVVFFAARGENQNAQTAREVVILREAVQGDVARLTRSVDTLSSSLSPLAVLTAAVDDLKKMQTESNQRDFEQDRRMASQGERILQLGMQVEQLRGQVVTPPAIRPR